MQLVEQLESKRKELDLSNNAFAVKLGIDESTWSLIRNDKRNIGHRTLKRISRVFPDLAPYVQIFLSQD
jgi:transcriptional regulator with XRE-family HTH domain